MSSLPLQDVVIIGGGPAGSALGSYLSMAGIKNIIFEKAINPRPHVGESMVTSSTRVFKDIGFLQTLEDEGFVKKYGASWHPPTNKGEFDIEFAEFPQEGIDQDYTYHVDRGKLDLLMLKHAEKLGSEIYQGTHVTKVLFDGDQACGVQVRIAGQEMEVPAKIVVDCSGRNTLLGRQLKLTKKDPIFDQYAVHAWYKDVDRGEGRTGDYIHIYFLPVERGWVWQIPITEDITSMGVVAEKNVFKQSKLDVEEYFTTHVNMNPDLAKAMAPAKRINEFKTEGDYSYVMEKFVGNGFLLVGDAARFVDPIFSSGVSIALYGAKYSSQVIQEALQKNDFRAEMFTPYETKMRGGVAVWYEFIRMYYKLLHLFTHFIASKEHRMGVLQLLQGEVYDREQVPVLKRMREFIHAVESTPNHIFKPYLTDIPID